MEVVIIAVDHPTYKAGSVRGGSDIPVYPSLPAGGFWMLEKTRLRNEVAILDSLGRA